VARNIERDAHTGVDTTGHSWDGISELNNPLPTWWLLVWGVCIAVALLQFVIYPSIPLGGTYWHGLIGYSSRVKVIKDEKDVMAQRSVYLDKIAAMSIDDVPKNKELYDYALNSGKVTFANNCQPCHGVAGSGRPGFPVLASDAWLWGGTLDAIQQTITYGIRSGHPQARDSQMPRFGVDGILTPAQIDTVSYYVRFLEGHPEPGVDPKVMSNAKQIFMDNCAPCHGPNGDGNRDVGAPRYHDRTFLYGPDRYAIIRQVTNPRMGVMPAWTYRLDATTIKCVALYVHSLGGGE
jgi:cytochrome c oxidase cbb3-type subunit 3